MPTTDAALGELSPKELARRFLCVAPTEEDRFNANRDLEAHGWRVSDAFLASMELGELVALCNLLAPEEED